MHKWAWSFVLLLLLLLAANTAMTRVVPSRERQMHVTAGGRIEASERGGGTAVQPISDHRRRAFAQADSRMSGNSAGVMTSQESDDPKEVILTFEGWDLPDMDSWPKSGVGDYYGRLCEGEMPEDRCKDRSTWKLPVIKGEEKDGKGIAKWDTEVHGPLPFDRETKYYAAFWDEDDAASDDYVGKTEPFKLDTFLKTGDMRFSLSPNGGRVKVTGEYLGGPQEMLARQEECEAAQEFYNKSETTPPDKFLVTVEKASGLPKMDLTCDGEFVGMLCESQLEEGACKENKKMQTKQADGKNGVATWNKKFQLPYVKGQRFYLSFFEHDTISDDYVGMTETFVTEDVLCKPKLSLTIKDKGRYNGKVELAGEISFPKLKKSGATYFSRRQLVVQACSAAAVAFALFSLWL
ncbi:unnamed protein product [Vitrella brassicaformis CCMP3155]|uniref:C2 domain-containing protein n=3 Tax=Vitrella brassicaformis TaxID=1169539 RepID=A0A0G4EWD2_VITBC|nr:unnamed protein product [Vitrella brassicaformis CCMP3155]|eukprot:CEM02348.1 unnamed protein product [Vitrella brassicaformis CCMP3155]